MLLLLLLFNLNGICHWWSAKECRILVGSNAFQDLDPGRYMYSSTIRFVKVVGTKHAWSGLSNSAASTLMLTPVCWGCVVVGHPSSGDHQQPCGGGFQRKLRGSFHHEGHPER